MQALIAYDVRGYLHLAVGAESWCFAAVFAIGGRPDPVPIFGYRPCGAFVDPERASPKLKSGHWRGASNSSGARNRRPLNAFKDSAADENVPNG